MSWARFDDHFDDDPDCDVVGDSGIALFLCSITWASRNLTDGEIPAARAHKLPGYSLETVARLLSVKWWTETPSGYIIRSYLKYNPGREEVLAERERRDRLHESRAEAGRNGGIKSGQVRREQQEQPAQETASQNVNAPEMSASPVAQAKHEAKEGFASPVAQAKHEPPVSRIPYPVSDSPKEQDPPNPPVGGTAPAEPEQAAKCHGKSQDLPEGDDAPSSPNCVAVFVTAFQTKFPGERPDLLAKHTKGLKEAMQRLGAEKYGNAVNGFFADDWPSESGYSVVTFLSQGADRWLRARPRAPTARAPAANSASLGEQSNLRAASFARMRQPPPGQLEDTNP